jgi:hypothetical protein
MATPFQLKRDPNAPVEPEAFRQDLNVRLTCPDCGDAGSLVEEFSSGDLVCGGCGASLFSSRFNQDELVLTSTASLPLIQLSTRSGWTGLVLGDKVVDTRSECEFTPSLLASPFLSLRSSCRNNGGEEEEEGEKRRRSEGPASPPSFSTEQSTRRSLHRTVHSSRPCIEPSFPSLLLSLSSGRSFADSEGDDPSRVGGPADPLLDASEQLSTVISFKDNNTGVSKALQMAAARVAKDQQGGSGRDLHSAFREIATMCEAISLPKSIIDTTKMLFKRVDEEKVLRGKSEAAIIAACIFIACRQGRVPRTFKEIVALTSVSKKVRTLAFLS